MGSGGQAFDGDLCRVDEREAQLAVQRIVGGLGTCHLPTAHQRLPHVFEHVPKERKHPLAGKACDSVWAKRHQTGATLIAREDVPADILCLLRAIRVVEHVALGGSLRVVVVEQQRLYGLV